MALASALNIYVYQRVFFENNFLIIEYIYTRSEARFARLLLDCELSYCFHWVIVVVGAGCMSGVKRGQGYCDL